MRELNGEARRGLGKALDVILSLLFLFVGGWAVAATISSFSHSYADSYNAFYYLQEIKSRYSVHSGFYHSWYHPYFWLLAGLGALFGLDAAQTCRLSIAVSTVLFPISIALLAGWRGKWWPSCCLFAAAACAETIQRLQLANLKQMLALSLLMCGYAVLANPSFRRRMRPTILISASLAVAAGMLMHLFVFFLGAGLITLFLHEKRVLSRRASQALILLFALALGSVLKSKDLFSQFDLRSDLPWMWAGSMGLLDATELAQFTLYCAAVVVGVLLAFIYRVRTPAFWFLAFYLIGLVAPIWERGNSGFCYRFLLCSVPVAMLALGLLISNLIQGEKHSALPVLLLGVVLGLSVPFSVLRASPRRTLGPGMPVRLLKLHARPLKEFIPKEGLVIAPHGIQFRIHYFLGRKTARLLPSETNIPVFELVRKRTEPLERGEQQLDCFTLGQEPTTIPPNALCVRFDSEWLLRKRR